MKAQMSPIMSGAVGPLYQMRSVLELPPDTRTDQTSLPFSASTYIYRDVARMLTLVSLAKGAGWSTCPHISIQ